MKQASALPVLMYHHVSPAPGLVTVSPETFHTQMRWLAEHNYHSVGAAELEAFLAGQPLPVKSVMISFDDGYLDNFVHAHPVLREFGLKAVLFLITGWIGEGALRPQGVTPNHRICMELSQKGRAAEMMLNWTEIAEMQAAGTFEFHTHTHTHNRWDRTISDVEQRREALLTDIVSSRQTLQSRLGIFSNHLCWPQGYYDDDYIDVAQQAGFHHLYTVEKGTVLPGSDSLRLPRIVVKDRADGWFGRRLGVYRHAWLGRLYTGFRGR